MDPAFVPFYSGVQTIPLHQCKRICQSNPHPTSLPFHTSNHKHRQRRPASVQCIAEEQVKTRLPVVDTKKDNGFVPYPVPEGASYDCSKAALSWQSIPEMWESLSRRYGDLEAVIDLHNGKGERWTYTEMKARIERFGLGLKRLGLKKGENIALFSENSARWLVADQGIMMMGGAAAVRGIHAPIVELEYIYDHSQSQMLIVQNEKVLNKLLDSECLDRRKPRAVIVLYGTVTNVPGLKLYTFEQVMDRGVATFRGEMKPEATKSDVAAILYTSGTTGKPKAVALTHENLLYQVRTICIENLDPLPGEVFVSVLPCWHIFERSSAYYCLSKAMTMVYSSPFYFRKDLAKHQPHVLIAVPRVFESLYSAITKKMQAASVLRRVIFSFFFMLSVAYIKTKRVSDGLSLDHPRKPSALAKLFIAIKLFLLAPLYRLANKLIWSKIREGTGGRLKVCVCGGGTLPMYLEDFFECAKIAITVGYGLTETSPVVSTRFPSHNVRGSAGIPLPGTTVKVVNPETGEELQQGETGDLMVKGPSVITDYYRNPHPRSKYFDDEGYFNTGDLVYRAPDGDIVVTGRYKDLIVLSNGENVEPCPIEDAVAASPAIDQIMVVGEDQKHLSALVVPNLDYVQELGALKDDVVKKLKKSKDGREKDWKGVEDQMAKSSKLVNTIKNEITKMNKARAACSANDAILDVKLLARPFTVDNGMMTQTLKIKRNIVLEEYKTEIEKLYKR
eukprot:Plantae.Rhodophyta-Hildenbrandia_rubra.ctg8493.p1 GENE.Plantae.Rhodophyta-Hildenbrandia_rubra.ctg8493~~Plantae.Rhodophyta-Hildenbrandia_rubra.ctg8493.p1  ORF type:complete len:758 (-),score=155.34 Plantae.Rhodophyta-Hildenbrandia_rubra.ctg8493:1368-3563(-)